MVPPQATHHRKSMLRVTCRDRPAERCKGWASGGSLWSTWTWDDIQWYPIGIKTHLGASQNDGKGAFLMEKPCPFLCLKMSVSIAS